MQNWPGAHVCSFAQALLAPPDPFPPLDPPPLPCPPVVMQLNSSTVPSAHAQQPLYKTLPPHRSRHTLARRHSLISQLEPAPALPLPFRPALPPLDPAPPFREPPSLEPPDVACPALFALPLVACPAWPAPPPIPPSPPQAPNIIGAPTKSSASEPREMAARCVLRFWWIAGPHGLMMLIGLVDRPCPYKVAENRGDAML